ncbi:MAG: helix-turn-helix domain-containing protein [Clostridiales bacterium]|nr:helix-turn-helix domain-containing protein [Clostridiales bacterium]
MEYLSIRQVSEKWGLSKRRIQTLCAENRIPGAMRVDYSWVIPSDAEKPADARVRTGKYMKKKDID